jgi:hypothetical protein
MSIACLTNDIWNITSELVVELLLLVTHTYKCNLKCCSILGRMACFECTVYRKLLYWGLEWTDKRDTSHYLPILHRNLNFTRTCSIRNSMEHLHSWQARRHSARPGTFYLSSAHPPPISLWSVLVQGSHNIFFQKRNISIFPPKTRDIW